MSPSFTTPPLAASPRGRLALLGDVLRRRGGRRGVSVLTAVLLLAGVGMFGYPVATDVRAGQVQDRLQERLGTGLDDPGFRLRYERGQVEVGEGLTRLRIPRVGLDVVVVQGTTADALRAGAGHYVDTPLPGEAGNVGVAGHRTTYGRPFNRLDEMRSGDDVLLDTPFAEYVYRVVPGFEGHPNPWPVAPTDYNVVGSAGPGSWLTLTTCHPKGSAKQRLILRLQLADTRLRGPGAP